MLSLKIYENNSKNQDRILFKTRKQNALDLCVVLFIDSKVGNKIHNWLFDFERVKTSHNQTDNHSSC